MSNTLDCFEETEDGSLLCIRATIVFGPLGPVEVVQGQTFAPGIAFGGCDDFAAHIKENSAAPDAIDKAVRSLKGEIDALKDDLTRSEQTLRTARDEVGKEDDRLLQLVRCQGTPSPIPFKPGETALAEVVLRAQQKGSPNPTRKVVP
jgi:hypothetical protein